MLKKYIFEKLVNVVKDMLEGGAPRSLVIARLVINKIMLNTPAKAVKDY